MNIYSNILNSLYYFLNRDCLQHFLNLDDNVIVLTNYDFVSKLKNINKNVNVYIDLQDHLFESKIMDLIVNNPFIIKVYCTNLNYKHKKTFFVPLGIGLWGYDYSSLTIDTDYFNTLCDNDNIHYNRSLSLYSKNKQKNYCERKKIISLDFYNGFKDDINCHIKQRIFNERSKYFLSFKNRENIFKEKDFLFYVSENRVDVNTLWNSLSECIFVISPPGGGYDCHRTYENLLIGNIPILIKNNDICDQGFFERVGCIIVDDYSQVTPEFLDNYIQNHNYNNKIKDELLLKYWIDKISKV